MRPPLALLAVSLFKPELEGQSLAGHVELINQMGWERCVVSLGDTLHRLNMRETQNPIERHSAASALGDHWIKAQVENLSGFEIPWRLLRHDEMLSIESYCEIRERLGALVVSFAPVADALRADIDAFVSRGDRNDAAFRRSSEAYILEELAADIAFAQVQPFTYIYPGAPLRTYLAMQEFVADIPEGLRGIDLCEFVRTRVRKGRVRPVATDNRAHS